MAYSLLEDDFINIEKRVANKQEYYIKFKETNQQICENIDLKKFKNANKIVQNSARNVRIQGNSILSFNPYLPPKFTEKYTLIALEKLGLKPEELMYPTDVQINLITRDPKLKKYVKNQLFNDVNLLIGEVRLKRDELIQADKLEIKEETEKNKHMPSHVKSNDIEQFAKREIRKAIIDVVRMKEAEKRKQRMEVREREYQKKLDEAKQRRRIEMMDKRKIEEERKKAIELERQKQYEEMVKKIEEKEQKCASKLNEIEHEKKNNAYCIGVERDLKILSVKENIREMEIAKQQEMERKLTMQKMRDEEAKERLENEKKIKGEKIKERKQREEQCRMNAQNIKDEIEMKRIKLVLGKEERSKEQVIQKEEQRKNEIQNRANIMKLKIEAAARNRTKQELSKNQFVPDIEKERRRQEELELKYKKAREMRMEKNIKEQIEFKRRMLHQKMEESKKNRILLNKLENRGAHVEESPESKEMIEEMIKRKAMERAKRAKEQADAEMRSRIDERYNKIELGIAKEKEFQKLQQKYMNEKQALTLELHSLIEKAENVSYDELQKIAEKYGLDFDELLKAAKQNYPRNISNASTNPV